MLNRDVLTGIMEEKVAVESIVDLETKKLLAIMILYVKTITSDKRSICLKLRFLAGHFVFTGRRIIEARTMRNRLIFLCDCFVRFAEVR